MTNIRPSHWTEIHSVMSIRGTSIGWIRRGLLAVLVVFTAAFAPGPTPPLADLPFSPGEVLEYRMRVGRWGTIGRGTMSVLGPDTIRGTPVYLLSSEFRADVGPIHARDDTFSWIDPVTFSTLRFEKSERTPLSRNEDLVEIFPSERRWRSDGGSTGRAPTNRPLDELSFIYFLRTLDLERPRTLTFDRHFVADRNPVRVDVRGRESIEVGAGRFQAVVVEMTVRDPARYRGEGVVTLHFTDDERRIPIRIESNLPGMGRTVLSLEEATR